VRESFKRVAQRASPDLEFHVSRVTGHAFTRPTSLSLVAADVRRRNLLAFNGARFVASAATIQGFKARTSVGGTLTPVLSRWVGRA
jgi:hypothetical protein